jgi:hypothetical protein
MAAAADYEPAAQHCHRMGQVQSARPPEAAAAAGHYSLSWTSAQVCHHAGCLIPHDRMKFREGPEPTPESADLRVARQRQLAKVVK